MSLAKKCDRCGNLYEPKDMDICGAIVNDIVGKTDAITNLALEVSFDQENRSIPEITITRMYLPDHETLDHLLDIRIEKLKKENSYDKN